jgi:hypothetical protein
MNRIVIIFLLAVVWLGCKNRTGNGNFESILRELCSAGQETKIRDLYTSGTLSSMKRAVKAGIVKKPEIIFQNYFTPDTRLQIIKSSIDGSDAVVRVRYLEHPVENVIGSEADYRFLYQERRWKLDFKKEIDEIIRSSLSGAGRVYLKKKASDY